MSDTETPTKSAKVLRDFKDAGTQRSFTQGQTVEITEGEFDNYAAAGLVGEPDAVPAATPAGKSGGNGIGVASKPD